MELPGQTLDFSLSMGRPKTLWLNVKWCFYSTPGKKLEVHSDSSCQNLGQRSDQRDLLESDPLYLDWVDRIRCYGRLSGLRGRKLRDNGRSRVPPNPLSTHPPWRLAHDRVRVAEGRRRVPVDLI